MSNNTNTVKNSNQPSLIMTATIGGGGGGGNSRRKPRGQLSADEDSYSNISDVRNERSMSPFKKSLLSKHEHNPGK